MMQPGIEHLSPGPLANTQPTRRMSHTTNTLIHLVSNLIQDLITVHVVTKQKVTE